MIKARSRIADADSVVKGHHIYKTELTLLINKMLQVVQEDTNKCDECTIAIEGVAF